MRYLFLIMLATAISTGCWTEQEVVSNDTTDTDSDSDTDTDSDTGSDTGSDSDSASDSDSESDEGCGPPTGITNWGGPCHTNADCPPDTECAIFNSLDETQGFCAPDCCNMDTADTDYCTDVAAGQEGCLLYKTHDEGLFEPPYYCLIICNTQTDCPIDTACVNTGTAGSFCYGYAS